MPSTRPKNCFKSDLEQAGVTIGIDDIQITQSDSFNMVEGSYTSGKNIRVVAQVRPAVVSRLAAGGAEVPRCRQMLTTRRTLFD